MITWTTGEMTIQVGHLIVRKQALMLPTNDTGSVIIQKNVEKKIFAAKQNSSFRNLPDLVSLFLLLTISRPPWGYVKTKNSFTLYRKSRPGKSPGITPDRESGQAI